MKCRLLAADCQFALQCPVDKTFHSVRFHANPLVRGHVLPVVGGDDLARGEGPVCERIPGH